MHSKVAKIEMMESILALSGCFLLILGNFIKVPCYPVSFTMQTFFLFMIAFSFPKETALKSVLLYLILATLGVPVFAGKANPLWIFGKGGGYLIAFPIAIWVASHFKPLKGLIFGHLVIYCIGFLGLLPFVSPLDALVKGILIFIPTDILKASIVYWSTKHEHN